jgi:general stress protein 26
MWDAIQSERTIMLGLDGEGGVPPRPMTALIEDEDGEGQKGPLWIFTATTTELARTLGLGPAPATVTVTSKGHDLFATLTGSLARTDDPAVIDRLWNPFVAAWYPGGKNDPTLALMRFDPAGAEIWENGSSLVAGIKSLFGIDPRKDYRDSKTEVPL